MRFSKHIGIDPDVDKSGIAIWDSENKTLELKNLAFFELLDFLKEFKENNKSFAVVVEGGWLNKSNWHSKIGSNASFNAKIGERTGANFETGKKIVEMCVYLKITHSVIQPKKSKLKHDYFKKVTGFAKRTNQEQRDAAMLVFGM